MIAKDYNEVKKLDLFKGIEEKRMEELLKTYQCKIVKKKKEEIIAFRGDEIEGFVGILSGEVNAEMVKLNAESVTIEKLEEGATLASGFIFGNKKNYPVDIIAKSEVKLLYIDKKVLLKIFREEEKILRNYLDEVCNKIQLLTEKIWFFLVNGTITQKLATYMLKNMDEKKIVELKPSLKGLAQTFAVARPSLSRAISQLIEENIIERAGKNRFKIIKIQEMKKKLN